MLAPWAIVALLAVPAEGGGGGVLEVTWRTSVGETSCGRQATLWTTGAGGEVRELASWSLEPSGQRQLVVPSLRESTLSLTADGCWALAREIAAGGEVEVVEFELFPTGRVAGRLEPPTGYELPDLMQILARPSAARPAEYPLGEGQEFLCPLGGVDWSCELSAMPLDLRLTLPGLASELLWEVEVKAAAELDLGTIDFREGATVTGWVRSGTGRAGAHPDVTVELEIESLAGSAPQAEGADLGRWRTAVDERGQFELSELPPASYRLLVSAPGYSPAEHSGLLLGLGERLVLEPVIDLLPLVWLARSRSSRPWGLEAVPGGRSCSADCRCRVG